MGERKLNAEQRRLSKVRALKEEHFPDSPSLEDQLAAKDRRIAELEREVEILELKLARRMPESNGPATIDPDRHADF